MAKYHRPIRRSQAISPFGVGAIIDFPDESLMVAGLDAWKATDEFVLIPNDQRLASRLGVQNFQLPPQPPERDRPGEHLPMVRFPRWHQCPRCKGIKQVPWNSTGPPRCDLPIKTLGGFAPCVTLPERRRSRMIPLRFVVACEQGHIDDFPWVNWVHTKWGQDLGPSSDCSEPQLRLKTTGLAGLQGVLVECVICGAKRSLAGASSPSGVPGHKCTGNRPWLGSNASESNCRSDPRLVQRGGSNAYFAQTSSSILIPPFSDAIRKIIDRKKIWRTLTNAIDGEGNPDRIRADVLADEYRIDPDQFYEAVMLKHSGSSLCSPGQSETDFRYAEYEVLVRGESRDDSELVLKPNDTSSYGAPIVDYFDNIVIVEKLAETRALKGFSRINPVGADELVSEGKAKLSISPKSWLPAVRVYGEGLFFTLKPDIVEAWAASDVVLRRVKTMNDNATRVADERGVPHRENSSAFYVLHALAHMLIRELSFSCGYSTASVRERIYCGSTEDPMKMLGILIYTAAGDAEGTLGGLVRQGAPGTLEDLVGKAIVNARWCASDPVCIESRGQGTDGLNMAACHACSLLPETSCEEGNRHLDRAMIVGTPENPEVGFFNKWLEQVVTSL